MQFPIQYSVTDLKKSYDKKLVLAIKSLTLNAGEFVSLMGKNGSGKSTLMRLLAQNELPDSGDITVDGKSLWRTDVEVNRRACFISEDHELPFTRKLKDWARTYRRAYPEFDTKVFSELCKMLEVDSEKSFHQLSRGQKMKAIFSLQAPCRPDIYILDEITSVLDAGSRWTLMEFLSSEAKRGALVIVSTNIASEMQGFATTAVFLEDGNIIFSAPVESFKTYFQKVRVHGDVRHLADQIDNARGIQRNGDGSWTYLLPVHSSLKINNVIVADRREITIADVQTYFTSVGVSK